MPYPSTAGVTARRSDATQRKRRGGLASMRGANSNKAIIPWLKAGRSYGARLEIYVAPNPVPGARFVIELPRA